MMLLNQQHQKEKNTLMLLITTSGNTRESIYDERYEYAEKVLNNIYQNDNFLPWIYELDNFNEWKKFKNLYKANPNLGISKNIEKLKEEWETAINQPLQQPSFLTRHCNIASLQETSLDFLHNLLKQLQIFVKKTLISNYNFN